MIVNSSTHVSAEAYIGIVLIIKSDGYAHVVDNCEPTHKI